MNLFLLPILAENVGILVKFDEYLWTGDESRAPWGGGGGGGVKIWNFNEFHFSALRAL